MNLTLTTDCNVWRKESRQPGRQTSLTQVFFRPERIVVNAQWLCALRTLPVLFLAPWSLASFLGHGLLDDFPPHFCRTFAVFHVGVCCKFTAFLPSLFDFSADLLPAEYPYTNIWDIHKYNPLLLRGQHAVAVCANTIWRNVLLEFRAFPYIDFVTCKYPRIDQINQEITTKTHVSDFFIICYKRSEVRQNFKQLMVMNISEKFMQVVSNRPNRIQLLYICLV
jgi:hypothetical protein